MGVRALTVTISDDRLAELQERASLLHVTPEALALAGIEDLLARPEDEFRSAVDYVLKKNAELYRRLA